METITIPPQSGAAFKIAKDSFLKVICPEGEQVSDMLAYSSQDLEEYLSNGKTFDYEETLRLSTGNFLYSNRSNKMLEILEDTNGVHDFLLAPCCPETLRIFYNITEEHPTCRENLFTNLEGYGVNRWTMPTAFNIFMNVVIDSDLGISVEPPTAKAGDYILFKAHMDLVIGLTSCSAGASNNYSFKPIEYAIFS